MVNILLHGATGRMGHIITDLASRDDEVTIKAGVDAAGSAYSTYPICHALKEVPEDLLAVIDVIVDFSTAKAVDSVLDFAAEKKLPAIICTTGLSREQTAKLEKTAEKTAILKSANMSVGINLIQQILEEAAPKLAAAGFDCEVVEKHHNQKLDAPSGTALALADSVNESLGGDYDYVYDRTGRRQVRPKKEIGISSIRGGTIVGDHDVIFAGEDEVITFSHRAYSRAIFGKGALQAAKFLKGKPAGLYSMRDVLA